MVAEIKVKNQQTQQTDAQIVQCKSELKFQVKIFLIASAISCSKNEINCEKCAKNKRYNAI